ncbi:MAG: hypothetical protein K2K74_08985 [Lachnospiraceae bacterium]|nr:hypothetical protein [Lachnospiraceae bacterium]
MRSEENYLDDLLNAVLNPKTTDEPDLTEEISIDSLEELEISNLEIPDLEITDLDSSELDIPDIEMPGEELGVTDAEILEKVADGIASVELYEEPANEITDLGLPGEPLGGITDMGLPGEPANEITDIGMPGDTIDVEMLEEPADEISDVEVLEEPMDEITDVEMPEESTNEISDMKMLEEETNTEEAGESAVSHETEESGIEEPGINDIEMSNMGISDEEMAYIGEEINLEDIKMPESEDELRVEDIEIPDLSAEMPVQEKELSIDGLDEAIQSETELQMAGELNIDELEFGGIQSDPELSDFELSADLLEDGEAEKDASISMDDNLEDVLNMLDDDDELAEINDMLKKSDNNEPIQDDMMDLLNQMADDEAASVNAGLNQADDEDDGVPLPEIPQSLINVEQTAKTAEENTKKESKKAAAKKKKNDSAEAKAVADEVKKPSKLGKFFNMLTEELVPEPTEEELAAEKEAKAAKKQENLTQKEEAKLAKKEEKKAKAEEKAAANKAKQEAAAQKKKEKQAQKAAKKEAKLAAEGPKKRIPPKKIAAAVVFGVSVGGAVIVATNVLSTAGFLQTARNAYYDGDYMTVYEATYGMELDDSESDGLIKAKSEVILKVQRRYDSYQTNLKMGREVEALDALLRGITTYDNVNADAEKYGVMAEVDAVKDNILKILEEKYGLDEAAARAIINNEDALSYTIALTDVIAGN